MRKTVFLDRDGLINQKAAVHDYIKRVEDFHFLPNVGQAIYRLNQAGYLVLVVTNQRGIARGMMKASDVDNIHKVMCAMLKREGAHVDDIFICPHQDGECHCRKPDIGLFLQAEERYPIDKRRSWMVGDSASDEEAGRRYGVHTILTDNLMYAVDIIMQNASETMERNHKEGLAS